MRHQPPQPAQVHMPQPVRDTVDAQGMEAGIAGNDLPGRAGCGVAFEYAGNIFTNAIEHDSIWSLPSLLANRAK